MRKIAIIINILDFYGLIILTSRRKPIITPIPSVYINRFHNNPFLYPTCKEDVRGCSKWSYIKKFPRVSINQFPDSNHHHYSVINLAVVQTTNYDNKLKAI